MRGYKDESIVRYASKRVDGIIIRDKITTDEENWVGWPLSDIYIYDENRYQFLAKLFEEERSAELEAEWDRSLRAFSNSN